MGHYEGSWSIDTGSRWDPSGDGDTHNDIYGWPARECDCANGHKRIEPKKMSSFAAFVVTVCTGGLALLDKDVREAL